MKKQKSCKYKHITFQLIVHNLTVKMLSACGCLHMGSNCVNNAGIIFVVPYVHIGMLVVSGTVE